MTNLKKLIPKIALSAIALIGLATIASAQQRPLLTEDVTLSGLASHRCGLCGRFSASRFRPDGRFDQGRRYWNYNRPGAKNVEVEVKAWRKMF